MKHLDLFSGIGGFALACDWAGIETIGFVEIDPFCQKVLNKHWPGVPIVEDIRNVKEIKGVVTLANSKRQSQPEGFKRKVRGWTLDHNQIIADTLNNIEQSCSTRENKRGMADKDKQRLILTGGFPCQPFSNAGRKRGANDHRYLWPQTLAVIKAVKPDWVLLENVAGILNMVFPDSAVSVADQATLFGGKNDEIADYDTISGGIDRDLRQAGYETLWFVIPAGSLSAPHRRDRVWIVANRKCGGRTQGAGQGIQPSERITEGQKSGDFNSETPDAFNNATELRYWQNNEISTGRDGIVGTDSRTLTHPGQQGLQGEQPGESLRLPGQPDRIGGNQIPEWQEKWYEVATRFCRVDDGLPRIVDRVDRLKALGNAIVPQVAYQIIKGIQNADPSRFNS